MCMARGGAELSVAEIAKAAGVYPNQITYHFGSKDSLMVHAAFLGLLHDAERIERIGERATNAEAFRHNVARAVLAAPSLRPVARALSAGIARKDLAPVIDTHLQLLFRLSRRYLERLIAARGWSAAHPLDLEIRTFWSAAFGATLLARAGVTGNTSDLDLAGTLTIHDEETGTSRAG